MLAHLIHCLEPFMQINKRPNTTQSAEQIPKPKLCSAKRIGNSPASQFPADPGRNSMLPGDQADPQSERCDDKQQQTIVHRLSPVITERDDIDIPGKRVHDREIVDTECNE